MAPRHPDTDTPPQYLAMSSRISPICLSEHSAMTWGRKGKSFCPATDRVINLNIVILKTKWFFVPNPSSESLTLSAVWPRNSKTVSSLDFRHVTSRSLRLTVASVIVPIRPDRIVRVGNKPLILFGNVSIIWPPQLYQYQGLTWVSTDEEESILLVWDQWLTWPQVWLCSWARSFILVSDLEHCNNIIVMGDEFSAQGSEASFLSNWDQTSGQYWVSPPPSLLLQYLR